MPSGPLSLFLEATQLKTVHTVEEILRDDPGVVEVQVVGTGAGHRRRPTEPVDADTPQCTVTFVISAVAETRRCRSALESWSWLDNKLKLPLRRAGAPIGRLIGLTEEKNSLRPRASPVRRADPCADEPTG